MSDDKKAQPNILIIMCDQLRSDYLGYAGNPLAQTPNIDALAARGTVFENAYVANPICQPNRASILTGQMPSSHGVRTNGITLDPRNMTYGDELRAAGYKTFYTGKSHFQNFGGPRGIRPGQYDGNSGNDATVSPGDGWNEFELKVRHDAGWVDMPKPYYGFDVTELAMAHADTAMGHFRHWMIERGGHPDKLCGPHNALPHEGTHPQVWRTRVPEELYSTTYVTEKATSYLDESAKTGTPFCVVASYPDPHHPWSPPGKWFDMVSPDAVELPKTYGDTHEHSMPHYKNMKANPGGPMMFGPLPWHATPEQVREIIALTHGYMGFVDWGVGQLMAALKRNNQLDNTIIIFTSDHGDMMGDHGMVLKVAMHYRGCIGVPLIVSAPGKAAGRSTALVSSIDIAPTLLELAGAAPFVGVQGKSLAPIMDDHRATVRDALLIEEDQNHDFALQGRPLKMRTLVTAEARMTRYYHSDHGELFDLNSDPDEMNNLFSQESGRFLRTRLMEQLADTLIDYEPERQRLTASA
jgi:arylsulfatase A-like enzyme